MLLFSARGTYHGEHELGVSPVSYRIGIRVICCGESFPVVPITYRKDVVGHQWDDGHLFHTNLEILNPQIYTGRIVKVPALDLLNDPIKFLVLESHGILVYNLLTRGPVVVGVPGFQEPEQIGMAAPSLNTPGKAYIIVTIVQSSPQ